VRPNPDSCGPCANFRSTVRAIRNAGRCLALCPSSFEVFRSASAWSRLGGRVRNMSAGTREYLVSMTRPNGQCRDLETGVNHCGTRGNVRAAASRAIGTWTAGLNGVDLVGMRTGTAACFGNRAHCNMDTSAPGRNRGATPAGADLHFEPVVRGVRLVP